MARDVGTIVRHDPAPATMTGAVVIGVLTVLETIFVVLFILGIMMRWNTIEQQQMLTFWLANSFLILAIVLALYRRFFLDDVVIVKRRKPKWEDLL